MTALTAFGWWRAFLAWHVATSHPWDYRLTVEAMQGSIDGMAREIGEALLPALRGLTISAVDAMAAFEGLAAALRPRA